MIIIQGLEIRKKEKVSVTTTGGARKSTGPKLSGPAVLDPDFSLVFKSTEE